MFSRNKYKEEVAKAKKSGQLSLVRLDLTDIPVKHLKELKDDLKVLDASRNLLTEIPKSIVKFSCLTHLNVSFNNLTEIPEVVTELQSLQVLRVMHNYIKEIPLFLVKLQSLEILNVYHNQIQTIPEEMCQLPALLDLSMACNHVDISKISDPLYAKLSGTNDQFVPNQILDKLYLGSYSSAQNRDILKERGITHILIAASGLEAHFPEEFKYKVIKVQDIESEDISKHFGESHEFIDEAISSSGGVLVHCAAGVSRSGAVIISYVMKVKNLSFKEAEELVLKARPVVSPNEGFQKQLVKFEEYLKSNK